MSIAAIHGQAAACEYLINVGAMVDSRSDEGTTPLVFASAQGRDETVALLLKGGASPSLFDVDGRTALSVAASVPDATLRSRIETMLVGVGAKKEPTPRAIDEALLTSAYQGDLNKVTEALDKGAELDVRGKPNINLWLRDALSASVGHPKVCDLLLQRGINPFMRDGGGFTAMHTAADRGRVECIDALAKAGLDPNAKAGHGQTPLFMAINARRPATIVAALLRAGANPKGYVADAKSRGLPDVVKLLIDAGASE